MKAIITTLNGKQSLTLNRECHKMFMLFMEYASTTFKTYSLRKCDYDYTIEVEASREFLVGARDYINAKL